MPIDAAPLRRVPDLPLDAVARTVRATGFWLAVVLPLAYLPLVTIDLVAAHPRLLAVALATNLLALAVGHGHEPSLGRGD